MDHKVVESRHGMVAQGLIATDWDRYHDHVPTLARLTRKYTRRILLRALRLYAAPVRNGSIVELGGGNSFFAEEIIRSFSPRQYHVVDTCETGLRRLEARTLGLPLILHRDDVLTMSPSLEADAAFSIGLIEHFDEDARKEAILAHVRNVRRGGCVIVSFPISTVPYRLTRAAAELRGSWLFHDETPLNASEVINALSRHADILARYTLWPLVLTQHMIVAVRK